MKTLKILIATLAGLMAVEAAQRDEKKVADVIKGLSEWMDSDEAKQDNEATIALRAEVGQIRKDLDDAHDKLRKASRIQIAAAMPWTASLPGMEQRPLMRFSHPDLSKQFGEFCIDVRLLGKGQPARYNKDLSPNADETGGYTIPSPQLTAEVSRMTEMVGVAARLARPVPMSAGGFRQTRRLVGAVMNWKAAGAIGTEASPTFGMLEMTPETLFGFVELDIELDEDAIVNLGDFLATEFAYGMALEEDRVAFNGAGIGSDGGITGILNSDRVTTWNLGGATTSGKTTFGSMLYADLAAAEGAAWEGALANANWLMHRTIKAVVKKLTDTAGQPTWQPAFGREPQELLGYPLITASKMPANAATAVSTPFVAFGDFRSGLYLGRRGQLRVDFSDHVLFKYGQRCWRAIERLDIAVMGFTAAEITTTAELSNPIVVLKTAAS